MRIGYARISLADAESDGQLQALADAGCERIFTDRSSGPHSPRQQLARALEELAGGDTLVLCRFDRLGRSLSHLVAVAQKLEERGVSLVSLEDEVDTSSACNSLTALFSALARLERDIASERTKAAALATKRRGGRWGRPRKMDHKTICQAKEMLRDPHQKRTEIARALGISTTLLYRWFPGGRPEAFIGDCSESAD